MTESFYNTTNLAGAALKRSEAKSLTQEELILDYFERNRHLKRSPSQVQKALNLRGVPITSIRRAMTNLTSQTKLHKTMETVTGKYGKPEYCWQLALRRGQQEMF